MNDSLEWLISKMETDSQWTRRKNNRNDPVWRRKKYWQDRKGQEPIKQSEKTNTHAVGMPEEKQIISLMNISNKVVSEERKWHYILIKGSIQEENLTTLNVYDPNNSLPK